VLGKVVRDVVITRDEIAGLMQGLLCTTSDPTGTTRLSTWAREHADTLGRRYATELGRRRIGTG
jgi:NADH dehydrogenase